MMIPFICSGRNNNNFSGVKCFPAILTHFSKLTVRPRNLPCIIDYSD
jgi:hypothetical protein